VGVAQERFETQHVLAAGGLAECGSCAIISRSKYLSPKRLLHATRSHRRIENQLHWVLDVHFAEGMANPARKDLKGAKL
jgi:predicted transposase YbfD/YdcC